MIEIELTEKQLKDMKLEAKKTEDAFQAGKRGMFLLQVWPKSGIAEGGFIHEAAADEIVKITRKYHDQRIFRYNPSGNPI